MSSSPLIPVALLAAAALCTTMLQAGSAPKEDTIKAVPETTAATVFVTGSLIPKRLQLQTIGTQSASPLRVIDRHEIDQTGRRTTAGAFVNEPSVRIIGDR